MTNIQRMLRVGAAALTVSAVGACSQAGGLGSILGSVLGGQNQQASQVSGSVRGVDTRNGQIVLQQSNGQSLNVSYDNQTQVVYNNQNFNVTSLENGDQVTLSIQQTQNGGYYTNYVRVDQSVSSNTNNNGNNQIQSFQGTVRRVDVNNGWFEIMPNNNSVLTVTMPYNASRADQQRFQNLRNGDVVRFTGTYVNNSRIDLRQFY